MKIVEKVKDRARRATEATVYAGLAADAFATHYLGRAARVLHADRLAEKLENHSRNVGSIVILPYAAPALAVMGIVAEQDPLYFLRRMIHSE